MAMSSAPARPDLTRPARRTVQIRGHVPPPPQPAKSMSLRDVPVAPRKVASGTLVSAAPVPNVRNAPLAGAGAGGTGTVLLTTRRRRSRSVGERVAGSPDRLAMWAFVMAVFLVLVATLSAH